MRPTGPELQLGVALTGDRRGFLRQIGAGGLALCAPHVSAVARAGGADMLRKGVRGTVVGKGESAWPLWCEKMVAQERKSRRCPPLIVQASNETDVIEAVRFARRNGLKVAVRTGGHSVWASFMRDEGLLIDLSLLNRVSFNRDDRSAVVQPALAGGQLVQRAAAHGLAFPVAHCAHVGLGGYLIGGGLGLNHDSWGAMACFSIRAADVITARGELITVSATRHAALYWALRGAGQGFPGIVTKLHLAMQSRPRHVLASMYVLPLARAAQAALWVGEALGDKPRSLEARMVLATGATGPPVTMVFVNAFGASADEVRARLAPFAASELSKEALSKVEAATSSLEGLLTRSSNPVADHGDRSWAVDSAWVPRPADAAAAAAEQMQRAASPLSHVVIAFTGRELPADAACSRIDRAFVGVYSVWHGADGDAANIAWLREASLSLQPFASGQYINEIDIEATPQKAQDCFSIKAWNRLADVRHRHDPERLFHGFLGVA